MEDMLPVDTCNLPSWSDWKVNSFQGEGVEICQVAILDPIERLCVALLRPAFTTESKRSGANGALCLLFVDPHGRLIPHMGVFDLAPTGAFAVHHTRGVVAVGLMNGSCMLESITHHFSTVDKIPRSMHCSGALFDQVLLACDHNYTLLTSAEIRRKWLTGVPHVMLIKTQPQNKSEIESFLIGRFLFEVLGSSHSARAIQF